MKKYSGVLNKLRDVEERKGIYYAKTDGVLYKGLRITHIIAVAWAFLMNALFVMSLWFKFSGEAKMAELDGLMITIAISSLALILGFVFSCFKLNVIGAAISVVSSSFLILTFGRELSDVLGFWGFKPIFYWRHLIPLLIVVITIVWMCAIAIREKIKTDKLYKKIVAGLYENFKSKENISEVSDEEWEEFLKNYNI